MTCASHGIDSEWADRQMVALVLQYMVIHLKRPRVSKEFIFMDPAV